MNRFHLNNLEIYSNNYQFNEGSQKVFINVFNPHIFAVAKHCAFPAALWFPKKKKKKKHLIRDLVGFKTLI